MLRLAPALIVLVSLIPTGEPTVAGPSSVLADVVKDDEVGASWRVPEEWKNRTADASDENVVVLLAPADGTPMQLEFAVELGLGKDLDTVLAKYEQDLADEGYTGAERTEARVARHEAKGIELDLQIEGQRWHVRKLFVIDEEFVYSMETVTKADAPKSHLEAAEKAWKGLRFAAPPASASKARRRDMLTRLCGSELAWTRDWKRAAARARAEGRLVLVYVNSYRGFDVPDQFRQSTFMQPDIIGLISELYVPLDLGTNLDVPFAAQSSYGMSSKTFGASCLIVTPDGEVVAESAHPDYDFFRNEASGAGTAPSDQERLERARHHARRGEHSSARELLEEENGLEAHRLRADLLRREHHGDKALAEYALALELSDTEELTLDLELDAAWVQLGMDRGEEASKTARRVLDARPAHPRTPEAIFLLGAVQCGTGEFDEAEKTWEVLFEKHVASRWAWQAAALISSPAWERGKEWTPAWLDPELKEQIRTRPYAPYGFSEAGKARSEAITWLIENQREDGSWLVWSAVRRSPSLPPDDFQLTNAAFAVRALLTAQDHPGVDDAITSALAYILHGCERQRADGGEVFYMDFAVWSYPSMLFALVEAHAADHLTHTQLERHGNWLITEILERQAESGGWSYYVSNELESGKTLSTSSFSFVTAYVLLALEEARSARLTVPKRPREKALDALEATRTSEVLFEYSLGGQTPVAALGGAAGRAPLCMLALVRAGRADTEDLAKALDAYAQHVGSLTKELGKTLMHAGEHGQGCHYPLFDHEWAAEAITALPQEMRGKRAVIVLEELLKARTDDGSFYDMKSTGNAWGTAICVRVVSLLSDKDSPPR